MILAISVFIITMMLSSIFSGFENGMVSIRKARLDHAVEEGSSAAKLIKYFISKPALMLATVLLGNNLCNVFNAIYYEEIIANFTENTVISFISLAFLTILVLIFGEITPKVWFRQAPYKRCSYVIYPIYLFYLLSFPFVYLLTLLVKLLNHIFPSGSGSDRVLLRDDFRRMIRESESEGLIDKESRALLEHSLIYDKKYVNELMISRKYVHELCADITLEEAMRFSNQHGMSRFPVHMPDKEGRWIGIFSIYDALYQAEPDQWNKLHVKDYLRPMMTIDPDARSNQVLRRARIARCPLLIVMTREGRQLGVISSGDVVQPLFGNKIEI